MLYLQSQHLASLKQDGQVSVMVCGINSKLRQGRNRVWKEIAIKRMSVNSVL